MDKLKTLISMIFKDLDCNTLYTISMFLFNYPAGCGGFKAHEIYPQTPESRGLSMIHLDPVVDNHTVD